MTQIPEISISLFLTIRDNVPKETTLRDELLAIKNGKVKELVQKCRVVYGEGNKVEYTKLKKGLPAVTYAASFKEKRAKDFYRIYNNLVVIDFDGIENTSEIKEIICKDKYTYSAWISPSGRGIKALIRISTDIEGHKLCFDAISDYYLEKYNLETDKSGSDITRLCLTSYDPELFFNENSLEWFAQKIQEKKIKRSQGGSAESQKKTISNPYITEGKNDAKDRTTIKNIIKFLANKNKSITSSYQNWYRVALAIASSFTPDVGIRHYLQLCALDKENYDEEGSQSLIEYCYRNNKGEVGFATIVHLANEVGFKQ